MQQFKAAILPYSTYYHLALHFRRASDARKIEQIQERALIGQFIVTKRQARVNY